jgi:hypothetical protein
VIPAVAAVIAPLSLATMIFSLVSSAGVSQASERVAGLKFGWGEPDGNTSNCNAAVGGGLPPRRGTGRAPTGLSPGTCTVRNASSDSTGT